MAYVVNQAIDEKKVSLKYKILCLRGVASKIHQPNTYAFIYLEKSDVSICDLINSEGA